MSNVVAWLREAALAALLASAGALAMEAAKPGSASATVPLGAVVALCAVAAAALAALPPPAAARRLNAWQLLAFGWLSAAVGIATVALLRHATDYALPLGALAAAAAWAACAALWLRQPER